MSGEASVRARVARRTPSQCWLQRPGAPPGSEAGAKPQPPGPPSAQVLRPRSLTCHLLPLLGAALLVCILTFQDIFDLPFRELLPSWQSKGSASWPAQLVCSGHRALNPPPGPLFCHSTAPVWASPAGPAASQLREHGQATVCLTLPRLSWKIPTCKLPQHVTGSPWQPALSLRPSQT